MFYCGFDELVILPIDDVLEVICFFKLLPNEAELMLNYFGTTYKGVHLVLFSLNYYYHGEA